jgi:hypothetical protein
LFIERSALEELGLYRELPTSQDFRLWCDLARRHWLGVVPDVVVYWRQHSAQLGATSIELQRKLSLDILREHLTFVTREEWTLKDARALRCLAQVEPVSVREGLRALERWERRWREASALSAADRRELERLTMLLHLRHLRSRWRDEPRIAGLEALRAMRSPSVPPILASVLWRRLRGRPVVTP